MNPPIALQEALDKIKQLKNNFYFRRETEKVDLIDSVGRDLGETIYADSMSPEFDIAAMDGFAVRFEDKYPLKIVGKAYAGDRILKIKCREAITIATGAIIPHSSEAVLKIEDAHVAIKYLKKITELCPRALHYYII